MVQWSIHWSIHWLAHSSVGPFIGWSIHRLVYSLVHSTIHPTTRCYKAAAVTYESNARINDKRVVDVGPRRGDKSSGDKSSGDKSGGDKSGGDKRVVDALVPAVSRPAATHANMMAALPSMRIERTGNAVSAVIPLIIESADSAAQGPTVYYTHTHTHTHTGIRST